MKHDPANNPDLEQEDKFALLLASSVHDMKNSLGMLLTSLGEILQEAPPENDDQRQRFSILQSEASRIRSDLVYLLGLYRLQREELLMQIEEVFIDDFLLQQLAQNDVLFKVRNLKVDLHCDPGLVGYFDEELVANVIGNVLVNAAKYTDNKISIDAQQKDSGVCISIADNGPGYPESMIRAPGEFLDGVNFESGSTFLGLHFAARIAAMHGEADHRGYITLSNQPQGGGCFSIVLP